jgi:RNA polymerase sigma-70 factor (ECF subfamily)
VGGPRRRSSALGDEAAEILTRARTGDADAWRRLYRAYAGRVAGYLRVQGVADPEDLTSDVFLQVFRHLGRFRGGEAEFRSWLFVIAHRRLIDERRRMSRRTEVPLDGDIDQLATSETESDALARVGTQRVQQLCERLGPSQRDVLLLRLVADLTVEQVAGVVDKSPGAVKALQRRGLAAIEGMTRREGVSL